MFGMNKHRTLSLTGSILKFNTQNWHCIGSIAGWPGCHNCGLHTFIMPTYLRHDIEIALCYLGPSMRIVAHHELARLNEGIGRRYQGQQFHLLGLVVQHLALWTPEEDTPTWTHPHSPRHGIRAHTHAYTSLGSPCLLTTLYLVAMVMALARDMADIMTMPERTITMVPYVILEVGGLT